MTLIIYSKFSTGTGTGHILARMCESSSVTCTFFSFHSFRVAWGSRLPCSIVQEVGGFLRVLWFPPTVKTQTKHLPIMTGNSRRLFPLLILSYFTAVYFVRANLTW